MFSTGLSGTSTSTWYGLWIVWTCIDVFIEWGYFHTKSYHKNGDLINSSEIFLLNKNWTEICFLTFFFQTNIHKPFGSDNGKSIIYLRVENGFLCAAVDQKQTVVFSDRFFF